MKISLKGHKHLQFSFFTSTLKASFTENCEISNIRNNHSYKYVSFNLFSIGLSEVVESASHYDGSIKKGRLSLAYSNRHEIKNSEGKNSLLVGEFANISSILEKKFVQS